MKSFTILIISKKPTSRQIALQKALSQTCTPAEYVVYGLFNINSILSLTFFRIRSILRSRQRLSIFIGNNIPYASVLLRTIFPGSRIVADLGYPIIDIPDISLWRRVLYLISDITILLFSSRVLLESTSQVSRFSALCGNLPNLSHKFFPFFVHVPSRTQSASSSSHTFDSLNACGPYFLFRGRLNEESGINVLLCALREYSFLQANSQKPSLTVLGFGKYQAECTSLASNYSNIFQYVDHFVPSDLLKEYTLNSLFCIGQLNHCEPRLRYTVPHKFYEAMSLNKPYLTPLYPPFQEFILQGVITCVSSTTLLNINMENSDRFPFFDKYPPTRDFIEILARLLMQSSSGSSQYPLVILLPSDKFETYCFDVNIKSIVGV